MADRAIVAVMNVAGQSWQHSLWAVMVAEHERSLWFKRINLLHHTFIFYNRKSFKSSIYVCKFFTGSIYKCIL